MHCPKALQCMHPPGGFLHLSCNCILVRQMSLRGRSAGCAACGDAPSITAANLAAYDYSAFTGQSPTDAPPAPLGLLPPWQRLTPAQLHARLRLKQPASAHLLLDVRPPEQFAIAHLPGAVNVPFDGFEEQLADVQALCGATGAGNSGSSDAGGAPQSDEQQGAPAVYVICRRGNDSQV